MLYRKTEAIGTLVTERYHQVALRIGNKRQNTIHFGILGSYCLRS
jgi:hypothetical protein